MFRNWIETCLITLSVFLAGCAINTEKLLSHDNRTMADIWYQEAGATMPGQISSPLPEARLALRRPLIPNESTDTTGAEYSRSAHNEIQSQFRRLPNPDLVMYVFPHLAGTEEVPVPGYSTVFPLHQRTHYALPGERLKDY